MAGADVFDPTGDGTVVAWAESGGPIMLRALDGSDPVELTEDEADRVASVLQELAGRVRRDDDMPLLGIVAAALCDLIDFVEERPDDATADDDVRALESAAATLLRVQPGDRDHLVDLLGADRSRAVGLLAD